MLSTDVSPEIKIETVVDSMQITKRVDEFTNSDAITKEYIDKLLSSLLLHHT